MIKDGWSQYRHVKVEKKYPWQMGSRPFLTPQKKKPARIKRMNFRGSAEFLDQVNSDRILGA